MSIAFVLGSASPIVLQSSFNGNTLACPARNPSFTTTTAVVDTSKTAASNYEKYSTSPESKPAPSEPSKWWTAYRDSLKQRYSPFRAAKDPETSIGYSTAAILAATTPFFSIQSMINAVGFGAGGDPAEMLLPSEQVADKYMAQCITAQYKQSAAPNGVYQIQCTEGTVKGQAEQSRNLSLSAAFRMKQRSSAQKYGDFTETRRKAIIAAHGCSYEEILVDRYPVAASAMVRGYAEGKGVCIRTAVGSTPEETYMAACVDKQMKFKAVPRGVYDVICNDGNAKGVSEYKRVSSLSARFRANQLPAGAKEALKYEAAKYARDNFGHLCSYEETYFNSYPAVAASMRPGFVRY